MSTTSLTAGEVMDRSAALLNDPAKTDFTYIAQLPYLNMAIDELSESLEESNSMPTNRVTSQYITILVGANRITPIEDPTPPHYPSDLIEIQEIGERLKGSDDTPILMTRVELLKESPPQAALMFWCWRDRNIQFNTYGATTPREIRLDYIAQPIQPAISENSSIGIINARSYLGYKTAALCAMFIGENEARAEVLETQANKALERLTGINNKGKQQIMTRHRPFRAAYKARGY